MECWEFYPLILPASVPHVPKILEIHPAGRPQRINKAGYTTPKMEFQKT